MLGMKLENYTQSSWWVKPWTKYQNYPTLQIVDEVVNSSPPSFSYSIFQSSSPLVHNESELQIMESEWRHELDEILDSTDENGTKTIKPMVDLDGNDMFKACLVSQLNGNPTSSKHRLRKVRNGSTLGEMGRLHKRAFQLDLELDHIVSCLKGTQFTPLNVLQEYVFLEV